MLLLSITACLAGLAGIFWGTDFIYKGPFVFLHSDEFFFTKGALAFIDSGAILRTDYFYGYLGELLPFLCIIKWLHGGILPLLQILFSGRILTLCFAIGTACLTYQITNHLTKNRDAARIAGLILSLAPLHAAMSHLCTPLVSSIFWMYAGFIFSYRYFQTKKLLYFLAACYASGAAIAVKFGFVTLIPIIYNFFNSPGAARWRASLGFFVLGAVFLTFNCGLWPWQHSQLVSGLIPWNFFSREHQRFMNPIVYFLGIIPGLGFFPMIFAAIGCNQLKKRGFYSFVQDSSVKARLICFEIPLIVQFLAICLLTTNYLRHVLFLFPYLSLLAGVGSAHVWNRLNKKYSKKTAMYLMGVVLAYQITSVAWMETRYLYDPFFIARNWIATHMKKHEKIWMGEKSKGNLFISGNLFPNEYFTENLREADYFLLLESYGLIVKRSFLNPLTGEPNSSQWQYRKKLNDPQLMLEIIRGQTHLNPEAHFHTSEIIPEFYLYRKLLGIFAPSIPSPGDVTIYKRRFYDTANG